MALVPDGGGGSINVTAPKTVAVNRGQGLQSSRISNPSKSSSYINQTADSRLNSILKKTGSPLVTGVISQTDDMVAGDQKFPFACRFLFNPGQIDVGYSIDEGQIDPSNLTAAALKGAAILPGTTQLSFSLLFDRTYEVAYGPQKGLKDLRDVGCYEDIWALESVTRARLNFASTIKDAKTGGSIAVGPEQGNMYATPVYVIFGGGDGSANTKAASGLGFVAYITSMQVSYALFSQRMVPMRCGVQLTCQQLVGQTFDKYTRNSSVKTATTKKSTPVSNTTSRR
jgi:hypothetical protein